MSEYNTEKCKTILAEKQAELNARGEARFPKRDDFSSDEVIAIKAYLGPWPRALEAAGLKEPNSDRKSRNQERRIRAKRKRNADRKVGKEKEK